MRPGLTKRQNEILDFLIDQRDSLGTCPTHEEIRQHFGFKSQNAVLEHLRLMEKKGAIKRNSRKARSIQILDHQESGFGAELARVPLVGWIPAGNPAFALECHEDVLTFPRRLFRGLDLFALKVKGDSMIGAGIFDGDLAILSANQDIVDGKIAAVVVDEEATLKRVFRTHQGMRLHAENEAYPDRLVSASTGRNCRIAGVLVGTIRHFK